MGVYLQTLALQHFRCFDDIELTLGPGLHIVRGKNASGKTSLLEAVQLLATTKSHRTSSDRELIQWGQQWARAHGLFRTNQDADLSLTVTIRGDDATSNRDLPRKSIQVNSVPRKRFSDIIGKAPVVLFGPDDLELAKGPPGVRRRFLNEAIAQLAPAYLDDLARYRKALRQRNECLKQVAENAATWDLVMPWDSEIAEAAAQVSARRAQFVHALDPDLKRVYRNLTDAAEHIDITYDSHLSDAHSIADKRARMRQLLQNRRDRESRRGTTTVGPHRDDLQITVDDRPLRRFGSQGQQRTAALALKIAQALIINERRDEAPVVLLDDCLSELDPDRAERVLRLTEAVQQVIVTTASWDELLQKYADGAHVIEVSHGQLQEQIPK